MTIDNDTRARLAQEGVPVKSEEDIAAAAAAKAKEAEVAEAAAQAASTGAVADPVDPAAGADPAAAKKDDTNDALDTKVWGSTGNEVGDSVLLLLQTSGVEPDVAKALLYDAVTAGDPTKIDRDALIEKVGKVNANLILAGVENYVAKETARVADGVKAVHDAVGGEANWKKVSVWAGKNVDEGTRTELAAMIDEGGVKARLAATELLSLYNKDEKNTSLGTTARIEGDAQAPSQGRAIDRATYVKELEAYHRGKPNPAALKAIQSARERGRKRGM